MACRKPIIATDIGGVSYAVNNGVNGYIYEPGDVKELTNKIIKLLSNKELMEQMGKENQ